MRKLALFVTTMLAVAPAYAQTAKVMFPGAQQAGSTTTATDGTTVYMPWTVPVSSSGVPQPAGTAADPIYVSGGTGPGSGNGNTVDVQGTGSLPLATSNATYAIPLSAGRNTVGLTINGLTGSGATLTVERSNDGGTTWTNANTTESSTTSSLSATITANGQARVGVAGATNLRLRVSTTGTGTASVAYNATTAAGPVFLTSLLPSTANPGLFSIGNVTTADSFIAPSAVSSALNTAYTVTLGRGQGTVAFAITGLAASGATLTSQYSDDNGANWYVLRNIGTATVPGATTFTTDGPISFTAAGHTNLRLIVTTAGTGNITIGSNASVPARGINLEGAGTAATNPLFTAPNSLLGGTASTYGEQMAGRDTGGVARGLLVSTAGVLAAPMAGTANSTGTVTAVAANTSTTVCPAATNPVVYEVQIYGTGGVLLGLDGQALTSTTPAAGSGAYTYIPTQYSQYTGPVARTNIITAYTGTAQTVVCNIVTRQ